MLDPEPGASDADVPCVPYGREMDLQDPREIMGHSRGKYSSFYLQGVVHLQVAGLHPQCRPVRSAADNRVNLP